MRRVLVSLLVLAGACVSDGGGPLYAPLIDVGDIGLVEGPPVEAPPTAKVGTDVLVTVTTAGGGCHSADSTEVDGLDVTPYDRQDIPRGGACTQILKQFRHDATVRFDTAGAQTVRFHVLRHGTPVEITAQVDVQP